MIGEVVDALQLASGAFFVRDGDNRYRRAAAYHWEDDDAKQLDEAEILLLSLQESDDTIRLAGYRWRSSAVPSEARRPIVAVPLRQRGDLAGVLLYGPHRSGSDIDSAELALIEQVARSAAVALDEIDANRLRAKNVEQSATIAQLTARLDELRRRVVGSPVD